MRRRVLRNQRGQSLVELAIIIVLFVTLTFGAIEFSWAWMTANMITQAARDGARTASIAPASWRTNGIVTNTDPIVSQVQNEIANVGVAGLKVTCCGGPFDNSGTIPIVTVTVTGSVADAVGFFPDLLTNIDREVTFRDEGRP